MTFAELSALLVLATALTFTPGPNTTLSTAIAVNRGLRPAMRFVCAVPTGWALLLVLCALGIGPLVLEVPLLYVLIRGLGMGYLLYLAWQLWRSAQLREADRARLSIGFWQGVSLQFLNIKAWMLALTLVGGWVAGHPAPAMRLAAVLPVMVAFGFASNLTYALIGAVLRQWLSQGQRLQWFNRTMALVLVLTAFWMWYSTAHLSRPMA